MNYMKRRILVIDDEEALREGLKVYLELEGYDVCACHDAESAMAMDLSDFDLILLDIMMDGMNGIDFAKIIRSRQETADVPIIFLTAKDSEDDMITGLDIGADDYIAKPYSLRNVKARIEAVLRRTGIKGSCNGVKCDRDTLVCTVDNKEVRLPRKEFEILALMLENKGRIFSREELLDRIWPEKTIVTDRSVDVHVTRLRSKISPYGRNIVSRSGYGYGWQD
ncbi:MAG: response regulator transcription factor [Muribaculaceae bacterium]|jgi:two-component system alkaline phosphatase synthesis response regulator PhoP|uniref:response regulator transcription factor n=1 Tax=Barnesiella sp. CU968 TaxID=2780099 RepID=UPI000E911B5D|nr:response regulator transcription factor [Barnesiella sp. CU968]MBJ2193044.1 response regulator transcription factor [Muribaculaceae bacterium]ROS85248.1 DNA-binding response regulator [Muribaculaceae bacterium Isolate-036 (Harlan)]ROT20540.1 DNA-binding response regulator [Muribaculaceae bacterium Isolate-113 (HZI)]ROT24032.1 DNA-binding response regulator [Muribaculaceae bacterium Isolate-114 (HZI)]RXE65531.1 response regulator transcription factor [Muribaculaceae bacterium Isolate-001 (NC